MLGCADWCRGVHREKRSWGFHTIGETLPLACVSTVANKVPWPCVSTAFVAKTMPSPFVFNTFAQPAKAVPFPCGPSGIVVQEMNPNSDIKLTLDDSYRTSTSLVLPSMLREAAAGATGE